VPEDGSGDGPGGSLPGRAEDPITFTNYPPTFPDIPHGEDRSAEVVAVPATAEATATVGLSGASTMSSQFSPPSPNGKAESKLRRLRGRPRPEALSRPDSKKLSCCSTRLSSSSTNPRVDQPELPLLSVGGCPRNPRPINYRAALANVRVVGSSGFASIQGHQGGRSPSTMRTAGSRPGGGMDTVVRGPGARTEPRAGPGRDWPTAPVRPRLPLGTRDGIRPR